MCAAHRDYHSKSRDGVLYPRHHCDVSEYAASVRARSGEVWENSGAICFMNLASTHLVRYMQGPARRDGPVAPHYNVEVVVGLMVFFFIGGKVTSTAYLKTYCNDTGVIAKQVCFLTHTLVQS